MVAQVCGETEPKWRPVGPTPHPQKKNLRDMSNKVKSEFLSFILPQKKSGQSGLENDFEAPVRMSSCHISLN